MVQFKCTFIDKSASQGEQLHQRVEKYQVWDGCRYTNDYRGVFWCLCKDRIGHYWCIKGASEMGERVW